MGILFDLFCIAADPTDSITGFACDVIKGCESKSHYKPKSRQEIREQAKMELYLSCTLKPCKTCSLNNHCSYKA